MKAHIPTPASKYRPKMIVKLKYLVTIKRHDGDTLVFIRGQSLRIVRDRHNGTVRVRGVPHRVEVASAHRTNGIQALKEISFDVPILCVAARALRYK